MRTKQENDIKTKVDSNVGHILIEWFLKNFFFKEIKPMIIFILMSVISGKMCKRKSEEWKEISQEIVGSSA